MALERFIPKSPDIFIRNSQDFEVAKFGHLNTIVEYINNNSAKPAGLNGYVQFNDNSALGGDAGLFWDNVNKRLGVGTVTPIVPLNIYNNNASVSSVILVEQDTSAIIGQINQYRKNGSVNLISGAEIGRLSFGGYFNSTYSPFSQVCSAVIGYYGGTGTDRTGGLRLTTWNGGGATTRLQVAPDGKVSIGTTGSNAKLQIVGDGSTSATTSLLVQNSAGSSALTVKDDLTTTFNGSLSVSAGANLRTWSQDDTNVRLYLWSRASAGTYVGTNTGFYHQISNGNSFNLNNNTNNILIGSFSPSASVIDSVGLLSTTISQSSAVAIGASSSVANFAGVAIGVNATTTGGTTGYGGIALGANAKANNYGFAMGYTVANDGEFVAAASISFNQIKPITNVYFGSGRILDDPSGTIRTGVGVSYAINGSGANGTNFAGGDLTLAGGKGTGSGTAGNVIFSTSTVGASGTTLQTLTERMRIDGSGNVGIGTTTPTARLQVKGLGSTSGTTAFLVTNGAATPANIMSVTDDGTVAVTRINTAGLLNVNNFSGAFNAIELRGTDLYGGTAYIYDGSSWRWRVGSEVGYFLIGGGDSLSINAFAYNATGTFNTAIGRSSGGTGAASSMVAVGNGALNGLTTGGSNTGIGQACLYNVTTGANNTAIGRYAGTSTGSNSNANHQESIFLGTNNGWSTGGTALTNTYIIGNSVRTNLSNVFMLGRSDQTIMIGQGTSIASGAICQIDSTTKGFLPPRMTNAQRATIGTPAVGLMVYCTDAVEGLYVYKSTGWTFVI